VNRLIGNKAVPTGGVFHDQGWGPEAQAEAGKQFGARKKQKTKCHNPRSDCPKFGGRTCCQLIVNYAGDCPKF
jgi:hypothetical protein